MNLLNGKWQNENIENIKELAGKHSGEVKKLNKECSSNLLKNTQKLNDSWKLKCIEEKDKLRSDLLQDF